jgi:anti-sigma factor RsiW
MTTSDIHSLSGAYALDAVDDLERAAFERHLRECEACALEVTELRETVSRLADTSAVEPPPSLRSSVLAAVAQVPQAPPGRRARREAAGHAAAAKRWRRFAAVSVAAGVIAAGAGVGTWAVADGNVDRARQVAAAAQERAAQAQQRAAEIEQVLAAPDVRVFTMAVKTGGTVNIAVARSMNRAVALLNGVSDPGSGRVHQLWMIPDAGRLSEAKSPGPLLQEQKAQLLEIGDATLFGMSVEPEGGSLSPTTSAIVGSIGII